MSSLEELKSRIKELPVSDILGLYVHITQKGHQKLALCPFHDDRNPSLNIDDTKGFWYCFVDHIGGDAIKFVQLRERLEFPDALKDICQRLGWNWEDFSRGKKSDPKFERGRKLLARAAQLYREHAKRVGPPAYADFLAGRAIDEESAHNYCLGFAPSDNILAKEMQASGNEALGLAEELGVIRPNRYGSGSHYDTFRERIIFPISDPFGQVIGFTGRATREEQKAKYINSADSFLFGKKNLLYGLHLARASIREKNAVILVEGHMDQMSLFAAGFKHTVAIMGTALGEPALRRLSEAAKTVYLALDNDQAGLKASQRINAQFMQCGIMPRFVNLAPHKDPDEFVQAKGAVELQKRLSDATAFLELLLAKLIPPSIPELSDRKLDILHQAYPLVAPLGDGLAAQEQIAALAKRIGLQSDARTIQEDYREFLKRGATPRPSPARKKAPQAKSTDKAPKPLPEALLAQTEKTLVQEVIRHPQLLLDKKFENLLDFVQHNEVQEYLLALRRLMEEIDESEYAPVAASLLDHQNHSPQLAAVVGGALYRYHPIDLDEKRQDLMLSDILQKLRDEKLKARRGELRELQQTSTSIEEQDNILRELAEIDRQRNQLAHKKQPRGAPHQQQGTFVCQ